MKRNFIILCTFLFPLLVFTACSGSEEVSADSADNQEEFTQVDDAEEPIRINDPYAGVDDEEAPQERQEAAAPEARPAPQTPQPAKKIPSSNPTAVAAQPQTIAPPPPPAQPVEAAKPAGTMMWSVQIGAFKEDAGAMRLVQEAKKKLTQPVYKEYDPVSGFYKVTVGSFASQEQASQYKLEVRSAGYPDSFTVEVRR